MTSDNEDKDSSRYLTFIGGTTGKEKFQDYFTKTMGVARDKEFVAALETDLGPLISEMESVSGEKTIAGGSTAQAVTAVTAVEKALYKMEGKALAHLTRLVQEWLYTTSATLRRPTRCGPCLRRSTRELNCFWTLRRLKELTTQEC
jgi:hypothetical protein